MNALSTERALAASQAWLLAQNEPEAILAAMEAGVEATYGDARRWINRIMADQGADGSWGGDLLVTAESLLAVNELRTTADVRDLDPAVGRALDWLRSRRGQPGAWPQGCSPGCHSRGFCHHFIGGFFSPGPSGEERPEARLRCGARLSGDAEVRFVASTLALRCLLAAGDTGRDVRLHLASLRQVVRAWPEDRPDGLTVGALLGAIHALIESLDEADRAVAELGLRVVGGKQRGDGSWVETDAFQALGVMSAAVDAGIDAERVRRALWHGARLLVASQQSDGSWGTEHGARRALVAWRTLRRVTPIDPD
jgi:hypothetical protein